MHTTTTTTYPHSVFSTLLRHSSAPRVNTDLIISTAIRAHHPHLTLTTVPVFPCRLLEFAAAGHATAALDTTHTDNHVWRATADTELVWFGKYMYVYKCISYVVYILRYKAETAFEPVELQYILSPPKGKDGNSGEDAVGELIAAASNFDAQTREEIWVFDGGVWERNHELWLQIQKASWEDVILDAGLKKKVIGDVYGFFGNGEVYKRYSVPWKRGVIFHGPPGNGKTLSIKALMNSVAHLGPVGPTLLYVKTLTSVWGQEESIGEIFSKAREVAPCLLVLEDLDSMISDAARSYFLNEVDGLSSNDGVCMLGSTNHLDRLDPGISKRPSRFDRKYLFPIPARQERVVYCHTWQKKLGDNSDVNFPDELCGTIADLTEGFSFAYLKEAFVASLMVIAGGSDDGARLEEVLKEQIENLREEMEDGDDHDDHDHDE